MAQFKAFNEKVEVNGQTVLSVVDGMGVHKSYAIKILEQNGIMDPKPGEWYQQQAWLNSFKQIAEKIGDNTLFMIGKQVPEKADWPPQVDNIEKALSSIDIAYHMNHRLNGQILFNPASGIMTEGIGHYSFEKIEENKVKMVCNNPYPDDFDKGIIEAAANKFKPAGANVIIQHDNSQPCRKKGADSCTYIVTW